MYIPKSFNITDKAEAFNFIQNNAFGQLISNVDERFFATHVPFLLSEDNTYLSCHVAFQNPQHQALDGQEVLLIFQGAHDYISPSWYYSSGVPTWNYQAVHVYGVASIWRSQEKLKWLVDRLTQKYESSFDTPWQASYSDKMLNAIVGIDVAITDIQCKYKLSQNRSEEDQVQVMQQLEERGSIELAKAMNCHKTIK